MSLPTHPLFEIYPSPISPSSVYTPTGKVQSYVDSFISRSLWFSPLIESAKSLISLLPGRFSTANLSGEALYALLSLISYYNNGVLGKPRASPYELKIYRRAEDASETPSTEARVINGTLAAFSMLESFFEQASSLYFIRQNYTVYRQLFGPLVMQHVAADPLAVSSTIGAAKPSTTNPDSDVVSRKATPHKFRQKYPHQLRGPQTFGRSSMPPMSSITDDASEVNRGSSLPSHPSIIVPDQYQHRYRYEFNDKMRRFKMVVCCIIESIKFLCRIRMFWSINKRQIINTPPSHFDVTLNQIQRQGDYELQQYCAEQDKLREYNINYKQWLEQGIDLNAQHAAALQEEEKVLKQAKLDKKNTQVGDAQSKTTSTDKETKNATATTSNSTDAVSTISPADSSAQQPPEVTHAQQKVKSTLKAQRQHSKSKPAQPLTSSAFISPLTSSPLPLPSSQTPTPSKGHGSSTSAPPGQLPAALMDFPSLQALKVMYINKGRGRIKHGQFGLNVISSFFMNYYLASRGDQTVTDDDTKDATSSTEQNKPIAHDTSLIETTTPSPEAIQYIASLYTSSPPPTFVKSSSSHLVSPIATQMTTNASSSASPLLSSPLATSSITSTQVGIKTIISEIVYWARPVVYSFLCIFFRQSSWFPLTISALLDFVAWYLSPSFTISPSPSPATTTTTTNQNNNDDDDALRKDTDSATPTLDQLASTTFYQKTSQNQLAMEQAAAWAGRRSGYWLYLLRSPLFESIVLTPLNIIGRLVSPIPVVGMVILYIIEILKMVQQHYFYTSGS